MTATAAPRPPAVVLDVLAVEDGTPAPECEALRRVAAAVDLSPA